MDPNGFTSTCSTDNECTSPFMLLQPVNVDEIKENDSRLVNGDYLSSEYGAMLDWEKSKHVYRRMFKDTSLHNQNIDTDLFFSNSIQTPLSELIKVEDNIDKLSMVPDSLLLEWSIQKEAIETQLDSITAIDSLISIANTEQDTLVLLDLKLIAFAEMQNHFINLSNSVDTLKAKRMLAIPAIETQNSVIAITDTIPMYQQTINSIYLETVAIENHMLDSIQKAEVFEIAKLCPLEYGSVVYEARALYQLVEDVEFDDESICDLRSEKRSKEEAYSPKDIQSENLNFEVHPIPTKDVLHLSWNRNVLSTTDLQVDLLNLHGMTIFSQKIKGDAGTESLNITNLSPGVYYLRLLENSTILESHKIIVIR